MEELYENNLFVRLESVKEKNPTELEKLIKHLKNFQPLKNNPPIFLINFLLPLQNTNYENQEDFAVLVIPGYKLLFICLNNQSWDSDFRDDFLEDISFLSQKFQYQDKIGRVRAWKNSLTQTISLEDFLSCQSIETYTLSSEQGRLSQLITTLITGSVNDINHVGVEVPEDRIDKIRKKIIVFDADQTRFIYENLSRKKTIRIQGLSGSGKTELLLHKLKEIYSTTEDEKIFFTCHNIALAKKLRERVPNFFDFMRVDKQIKWNEKLWVSHAWGSQGNPNSGLYALICDFYQLPFHRYSRFFGYKEIFAELLEKIRKIPKEEFKFCLDYLLIDESQDFPKEFFELIELVVKEKIYAAGDVFQNIFAKTDSNTKNIVDINLRQCYRTDPRTLMFAHGLELGLFELEKLQWFSNEQWKLLGYEIKKNNKRTITLTRTPNIRFSEEENYESVKLVEDTSEEKICELVNQIRVENETVKLGEIAIIFVNQKPDIFKRMDSLTNRILMDLNLDVVRGYEEKQTYENKIYVTNANNVKGLEFPFVICVVDDFSADYQFRSSLYTMITRSFLRSYILLSNWPELSSIKKGLMKINADREIEVTKPNSDQLATIKRKINLLNLPNAKPIGELFEDELSKKGVSNENSKQIIKEMFKHSGLAFTLEEFSKFVDSVKDFY